MAGTQTTVVAFLLGAIVILILSRVFKRSGLPLPPGPRKLPIFGNLFNLPTKYEWFEYSRLAKELNSDVLHMEAAGIDFIILNSFQAANDLFEKRSAQYSSRPQFPMVCDLMGWGWLLSAMVYGEPWKERRRMFQRYFQPSNKHLYQPVARKCFRSMLQRLVDDPEDFMSILRHTTGGVSIAISYGLPLQPKNDPNVELAETAAATISAAAVPGAFLVDVMQWLKYVPEWVPGAGFKRKAREWRVIQEAFRNNAFDKVLEEAAKGKTNKSLSGTSLEAIDESKDRAHQLEVIKDTAGIVFFGGSDTLLAAMYNFIIAMMMYPEVQAKAQREVDAILGDRLPDFNDQHELPYVAAIVKEILRWRPSTPTALADMASEDDVYKGYHIPKNAIVIGNAWAILHNEDDYPEPDVFKPERFLKNGVLDPTVRDPGCAAFGFGRRICPGKDLALSMMWVAFATLLKTLDFSHPVDENGDVISQKFEYSAGLIYFPQRFKCTIKPRSEAAERLIRTADL